MGKQRLSRKSLLFLRKDCACLNICYKGDLMRKKAICMIIIVCALSTLIWIGKQNKEQEIYYFPKGKVFYAIEEKEVYNTIGVDVSLLKQFHIAFPLSRVDKSGIILLKYDVNCKPEVHEQVKEFIDTIQDVPFQVYEDDTYYFYVYGKEAKKWMREIKERMIK